MNKNNPGLPLHCLACGHQLLFLASSAATRVVTPAFDSPVGFVHHYRCSNPTCDRRWKFGPQGDVETDTVRADLESESVSS